MERPAAGGRAGRGGGASDGSGGGETLDLVEEREHDGTLLARWARARTASGDWTHHGPYWGYHRNGQLRTEGEYRDGLEEGLWRDYHDNGFIACAGDYRKGLEQGLWRFFDRDGNEGPKVVYRDGVAVVL